MLFLGAGASAAFGIATMEGFVEELVQSLSDKNDWRNEVLEIKRRLEDKKKRWDIEILSTALSILSSSEESSDLDSYLTPLLGISDDIVIPKSKQDLSGLLYQIRNLVYKRCAGINFTGTPNIYGSLHNALNHGLSFVSVKINKEKSLSRKTEPSLKSPTSKVYTTNYDQIYEWSLEDKEIPFSDGFEPEGEYNVFTNKWDENKVCVAKLHGSINYYSRKDGKIVKSRLEAGENPKDIFGEELQRMMIYPIGEKYVTKSPYLQLLNKFYEDLMKDKLIIVIGYSFRDDPINNVFIERIKRNGDFKIILVAPHPEKIVKDMSSLELAGQFQKVTTCVKSNKDSPVRIWFLLIMYR